jgi:hypothetical protein
MKEPKISVDTLHCTVFMCHLPCAVSLVLYDVSLVNILLAGTELYLLTFLLCLDRLTLQLNLRRII